MNEAQRADRVREWGFAALACQLGGIASVCAFLLFPRDLLAGLLGLAGVVVLLGVVPLLIAAAVRAARP